MDTQQAQTLIVLGEKVVENRLLSDRNEALEAAINEAMQQNVAMQERIEQMTEEKRTLMADIGELRQQLENAKEERHVVE